MVLFKRLCLAVCLTSSVAWGGTVDTHSAAKQLLPEYLEFLTFPNVAAESAEDIQKNANWLVTTYQKYGFDAQLLKEPDNRSLVFAEYKDKSVDRPTVLFYAHFDGQPVSPDKWEQNSPWEPALKKKIENDWATLPLDTLLTGKSFSDELRLFARSSADAKAPIMMMLASIRAMQQAKETPAINIKVLLDSREENGSPTLNQVITENKSLLDADAVIILDGPMHSSNRPTIVYGHRGISIIKLTVYGPSQDIHSGHFGNVIDNPAQSLANLLASFKNENGRVNIKGYYDGVNITEVEKEAIRRVPIDEQTLAKSLGKQSLTLLSDNYYSSILYPSLNVNGLHAADADKARTIIPASASARIDIRTVTATPGKRQIDLIKQHLLEHGFHLVEDAPTEHDRIQYNKLAQIEYLGGTEALQTPLDSPLGLWLKQSIQAGLNEAPVEIPIMGGTVPTAGLTRSLKSPVILLPLVNSDNNQHAPNENLRIGNYFKGTEILHSLLVSDATILTQH